MNQDQRDQTVQSLIDWFLHVGQDDSYYQGEGGVVHARRDAEALYRSVVAPLLAERDEVACMQGCDATPRDPAIRPTAGQMLHQLHGIPPAEQVGFMQRMLDASEAAVSCFTRDHEGRLAHRDQLMVEVSRLRREVEFEANGADTFSGADAVAERIAQRTLGGEHRD